MSSPHSRAGRSAQSLLRPLPEFDPDPGLWDRIQSVNVHRIRRHRIRLAGGVGFCSLSLALAWFFLGPFSSTFPSRAQTVSVLQERSQELQDQWRSSEQTQFDPAIQARLRWIDRDLQAAYDRGASEVELGSLWAQRSALLQTLVRPGDVRSRAVTRI
jgi:hypothetical protein